MTIVVDASLATKWVKVEEDSILADSFFVNHFGTMHAPDLLLVEVAGAVVKDVNQRLIGPDDAVSGLASFLRQVMPGLTLHRSSDQTISEAARLAIVLGHPIKDCVYLALADQLGCPLATSDIAFARRVADPARVRLLADLV